MDPALALYLAEPLAGSDAGARLQELVGGAFAGSVRSDSCASPDGVRGPVVARRYRVGEESFVVLLGDEPHPDRFALAEELEGDDAGGPIARHRAWLAVRWEERELLPEFADAYPPMARVLAEACGESALVLHAPQWRRCAAVTDPVALAAELRRAQPLLSLGIVHTDLGCLLADGSTWSGMVPTPLGPIEIAAAGPATGPAPDDIARIAEIVWGPKLRFFRARLPFSLLHRPARIVLDGDREVSVEFQNILTRARSQLVTEKDVIAWSGGAGR